MHIDMSMARVRLQGTGQTAFGTRQLAPDACAVRGAAAARARCGTLGQAWHNRRQPAPTPPRHATPSTAAPLIRLPSASTRGCSLLCLALPVDRVTKPVTARTRGVCAALRTFGRFAQKGTTSGHHAHWKSWKVANFWQNMLPNFHTDFENDPKGASFPRGLTRTYGKTVTEIWALPFFRTPVFGRT